MSNPDTMGRTFYGQFDPPVDRFIFERYFPEQGIQGVFVECGAFDGETECSCRFFEESMGWSGFNLEPVPWLYEKLASNRPGSRNLNVGLSSRTETVRFQSVVHPTFGRDTTIGAIEHSPELRASLEAGGCRFEEIEINVITWSEFIAAQGIACIDLLVLDVEGHELEVLSGMKGSDVLPHVMCVEFGHIGIDRLRTSMRELGYEYDVTSHANAYFVRKDMQGIFALRHAAAQRSRIAIPPAGAGLAQADIEALKAENERLRVREAELAGLVSSIFSSRSWKAVQLARRIMPAWVRSKDRS